MAESNKLRRQSFLLLKKNVNHSNIFTYRLFDLTRTFQLFSGRCISGKSQKVWHWLQHVWVTNCTGWLRRAIESICDECKHGQHNHSDLPCPERQLRRITDRWDQMNVTDIHSRLNDVAPATTFKYRLIWRNGSARAPMLPALSRLYVAEHARTHVITIFKTLAGQTRIFHVYNERMGRAIMRCILHLPSHRTLQRTGSLQIFEPVGWIVFHYITLVLVHRRSAQRASLLKVNKY